eukprot:c12216_g2_i1.p1 GENE.c12216_g2_i1~~c12216_g2_i1.p1  ORF type:complete len:357 (-),score=75.36 c12216_g2_i1:119-1189(-)
MGCCVSVCACVKPISTPRHTRRVVKSTYDKHLLEDYLTAKDDPLDLPVAGPSEPLRVTLSQIFQISPFAIAPSSVQSSLPPTDEAASSSTVSCVQLQPVHSGRYSQNGYFGVELDMQPVSANNTPIVLLVIASRFIEEKMFLEEGVFRLSGSVTTVKELSVVCNEAGGRLRQLPGNVFDITVCSLLKHWLSALPSPLVPAQAFVPLVTCEDMLQLRDLIAALPEVNRNCLRLFAFLMCLVASHSDTNKMNASNLSKVLAPSLLRQGPNLFLSHFGHCVKLVFRLIVSFELLLGPLEDAYPFAPSALAPSDSDSKKLDSMLWTNSLEYSCFVSARVVSGMHIAHIRRWNASRTQLLA